MGFLFARVANFYSYTPDVILKMPIRMFWHLAAQIDRIKSQDELRQSRLYRATHGGQEDALEDIQQEIGNVGRDDPMNAKRDEKGFAELRNMFG